MDLTILKNIVIIFLLSTLVNLVFNKIKMPTIIGYLITGIIAGPYALAIIPPSSEIELMAEIGIILLLFSIGLEFSLNHLLKIRKIVFLGGFLQLSATTIIAMFVSRLYQLNWTAALFIGMITALSSTAVVLKILQERSEITSNYGRTVLGILIFQDIILIPMLLFTPILAGETQELPTQIMILVLKALLIIGLVYSGNKWLMPKLLHLIALTKNQELFFMGILLICLSVALFTAELGMSLAFGAFLAGLMISESDYSHNAFGNIIPFKNIFASFFFVSIGMLLDLGFVMDNSFLVISTVILVIVLKMSIGSLCAFILGHTLKGTILVGLAISQVGEFSFILAQLGMDYKIIPPYYFQLFLSVAVLSMAFTPFLIQVASPFANLILKLPIPKILVEGLFPLKQIDIPNLKNHLVLIGKDSRALNLSVMAKYMNFPYISIVFDPAITRKKQDKGETVIYGDALNEPILKKAHVDTAEMIVISIGDLITAMAVCEKVRSLNKHAFLVVRTKYIQDIEELYKLGADQVIPEEFETAINLFERVLIKYLVPRRKIVDVIEKIRKDNYGIFREKDKSTDVSITKDIPNIEIFALSIDKGSLLVGKSISDIQFRKTYGVTVVALKRGEQIVEHPGPEAIFKENDVVYVLGKPDQVARAVEMLTLNE
ncbi:MAG: monovalent cation:proton antiporter-2 (CPA2) family protein [Cyclobacteriaceae bacterium]|nr:monovalent cation:proton antiporter-2 (CPA2) family protein [Cyclobacteriaceae bacterium]